MKEEYRVSKINESAHALENVLRESDEFKALADAYNNVMSNEISKKMFEKFRDSQMELQEKQMSGEEISEEDVENARKVVEDVQQHENIAKLMEQEQSFNLVINEVSSIITKPLEELYSFDDGDQGTVQ